MDPTTLEIDEPITIPDDSPMRVAPPEGDAHEPEGGAGQDGPADIMDFEFDNFEDEPAAPEPERKERKIVDVEPEPEGSTEDSTEGSTDEPPAEGSSALRDQVLAANERAKAAAARQAELEAEIESLRAEKETVATKLQQQTEAITGVEAASHPDVIALQKPWERSLENLADGLDDIGEDGDKLRRLAPALLSERRSVGNRDSEGYDDRRETHLQHLQDEFPDNWKEVSRLLGEGARVSREVQDKIKEVSANAEHFRYEASRRKHQEMVSRYEEIEKGFGQVPQDLIESDPGHHSVILHNLIEAIPSLKERQTSLKQHLRRVNLPLGPLDPKQLEGMSESDQIAHMQERINRYEADRLAAVSDSWENYNWRMVGPVLHKLLKEAQGRSATIAKSTPAPRDSSAGAPISTPEDDAYRGPEDFEIDPNPLGD
jgi:hypothetical protein